ncbi:putative zinc finger protein [Cryptosporidium felis]|nr:putative zinc finger protein [Cryptosporidium felis]
MDTLRDNYSTSVSPGCFVSNASLFQRRNSSELVRRQLYKTKMCAFYNVGKCTRGNLCAFAHSVQELRPLPDLRFTRLCELTKRGDICRDVNCTFAHSLNDLRTTEIPPSPLSEFNTLRSSENTTLIRKLGSTTEPRGKFRISEPTKEQFSNRIEGEDMISSADTTPQNLTFHLKNTERDGVSQWRKVDNSTIHSIGSIRGGIFSYSNEPEISQFDNWIYSGDFTGGFTSEVSGMPEVSCKFIHQSDFQEPPNYFSSKCLITKGISDWDFTSNDEKISAFQYDILNIIGDNGHNNSGEICSIEKGTLHIIN